LYAAVDKARAQAAELDIEWESLRAQRRAAAAPARVQRIARSELNMRSPNASTTIYLKPSESAGAQK
jgi:cell division protein FtsL